MGGWSSQDRKDRTWRPEQEACWSHFHPPTERREQQEVQEGYGRSKPSPSNRLNLPMLQSAPSTGDQMFKYMSLWELYLIQTVSEGLVEQILAPELRPWLDGRYGLDMWRLRGRLSLPSMTAWRWVSTWLIMITFLESVVGELILSLTNS